MQWPWRRGTPGLPFRDRRDAGERLAARLGDAGLPPDAVVLGIPRGGVVVAARVARALGLRLDVVVAHKLGAPGNPEFAIGAVTADGSVLLEPWARTDASDAYIAAEAADQVERARRREATLRHGQPPVELHGRTAVIVDDGIATGATVRVAVQHARAAGASSVIVAAPVAPAESVERLARLADDVIVVAIPDSFFALSQFYDRFDQVDDADVADELDSFQPAVDAPPLTSATGGGDGERPEA